MRAESTTLQWREVYPDGHFDAFFVVGPSNDESNPGIVVRASRGTAWRCSFPRSRKERAFKYRPKSTECMADFRYSSNCRR